MRWRDRDVLLLVELYQHGLVPADIAERVGRSLRATQDKLAVLRRGGVLEYVRGRGRPSSPPSPYVDSRAKERDRDRKEKMRLRLVERSLRVTPAQAEILERARARGGFRSTSALVRAVLQHLPEA